MRTIVQIQSQIEVVNPLRMVSIIRKTEIDDDRVIRKFGLSTTGEWVLVPEGMAYPKECMFYSSPYENEFFAKGDGLANVEISDRLFLEALAFPPETEIVGCRKEFDRQVITLTIFNSNLLGVKGNEPIPTITPNITRITDDTPSKFYKFDWNLNGPR